MFEPIDIKGRQLHSVNSFSLPDTYKEDLEGILIPEGEIENRTNRMSEVIEEEYKNLNFYVMPVLKGSIYFFTNLMYKNGMNKKFEVQPISAARYGDVGDTSAFTTKVIIQNPEEISGKDILVVEDIIDEGLTLIDILTFIKYHNPNSIGVAALLDKPGRRNIVDFENNFIIKYDDATKQQFNTYIEINRLYIGFTIDNHFVVGHGLDYKEQYRGMCHLGVLKPSLYN